MKQIWQRITKWELWPFWLIYIPLAPLWLYYIIKSKQVWFFSTVNPTLTFAGFEGEDKREMYEQLPKHLYPKTIYVSPKSDFEKLKASVASEGLQYPFIAKPDIGMHAMMFRKIENEDELLRYHNFATFEYLVQSLVDMPLEFSVFHIRYPGESKGVVTGFIQKDYLAVTGDGVSTLHELIMAHPKAKYREAEMQKRHGRNLDKVIPKGEKFLLSIAGNHNRGARFIDLSYEIDERLTAVFDEISMHAEHFYYGRYDLKCTSVEDLKAGKNISILEFNGTGAEPNHIYDCGMSYGKALSTIAMHWKHMYNISKINHKKGVPYWSYKRGKQHLKKAKEFFKKLRQYDLEF